MKIFILFVFLFLTACAASGTKYQNLSDNALTSPKNAAKIVLYRTDQTLGFAGTYWVEDNGEQICDIHNSSYLIHDANVGLNIITSSKFGRIGTARLKLNLKPQETIYVRMDQKSGRFFGAMAGSFVGDAVIEGASDSSGPVELTIVTKETASKEMIDMGQEEDCR